MKIASGPQASKPVAHSSTTCRNGDVPENQIIKEKNNFLYMAGSLLRATQVFYHEKLRTVLWNIYIFAPVCR